MSNTDITFVYRFGSGRADGDGSMKPLLGGKGANLAEMTRIGLPVPPGFTISTDVCTHYYENGLSYPAELERQVGDGMAGVERALGKSFGGAKNPLLVSVRSGARESMPGMMDTILNLGMNDVTVEAICHKTGNPRFAWDSYRRFIQMYGGVVMGIEAGEGEHHEPFSAVLDGVRKRVGAADNSALAVDDLREVVAAFKRLTVERTGREFPQDPRDQLWGAIGAVFGSWENDRAKVYRRKYGIPSEWGTAVTVQAMVFGNMGDQSATGVAFTRDPASGENVFYGEYLINAQGEDVVAGIRTPHAIERLADELPAAHERLVEVRAILEAHFRDMQDLEFTVEEGDLYILQTRNGKRTGPAAIRIATELVDAGIISKEEAVQRVPADSIARVLAPIFDRTEVASATRIARGLPAGPGAASGRVVFNANRAADMADSGEPVILVRIETSTEDLRGMIAAEGILTACGGVSSHAALVARQMGKVCVCGASSLEIDYASRSLIADGVTVREGEFLSLDGTTGDVFAGRVRTSPSEVVQVLVNGTLDASESPTFRNFERLMGWADEFARMEVRTNADTPGQVQIALAFGARGVGLCRTEHMFFEEDRIVVMREMILAASTEARLAALAKLLPYQREDFVGIFRVLAGRPATIRLLDPPLHEFLPHETVQQKRLAASLDVSLDYVVKRLGELHEFNPMLGHRGCRLGIVYPEISEMQARAIFEAAAEVQREGVVVRPEIMIPLVGYPKELALQTELVRRVAGEVASETGQTFDFLVGTMIEVPRAALVADRIAEHAEFFSFGTNDLTQTTLGMSRDDSGTFLPTYRESDIVANNPFAVIDRDGVGELMRIAVEKSQRTRPGIKLGLCGEHGGEPTSVKFCHELGLNYVSCSPYRVPVARLAAAQAALVDE